jgi:O-succinylbenzoate synthase
MRIAQARVVPYCLPLKRPWVAASTTLTERRGALLHLTSDDGLAGWGDCAPLPSGGMADQILAALSAWARRPASADFFKLPAEVRWAIDTAQADMAAQRAGAPLWRHLGGTLGKVGVNAALGPLDDGCAERLAAAVRQGFHIGKIKLGIAPVAEEIARLKSLAGIDRKLRLRLDANRAWGAADALRFLTAIADLPIDGVEEPLAAPTLPALAALQAALPYAIAVDESLLQLGAVALIEARAVRRLVLKPARLGGMAATQAIAQPAAAAGIEIVITSVVDSAIGVMAAAHLAAAVSPTLVHGLGTSAWLAADVAAAPVITNGLMQLPDMPGLGIHP